MSKPSVKMSKLQRSNDILMFCHVSDSRLVTGQAGIKLK